MFALFLDWCRALENKSTAIKPVSGDALRAQRAAPGGTGVAPASSLIQPPKLDKFAEQIAANPLPDLMTPFGIGNNESLPVAGNTTGAGVRDPGFAMAGDTIAALTSILKDKVNSSENVAMSSMFTMLQQQQQQSMLQIPFIWHF